jgi:signal transduction histidine kinase
VKQYQLVAARKKLTVEWQITAPVEITAERNFAQRIVENLISNAVKFSTPGKAVRVWCKEEASFGVVAVADEGPGLTPDDERHLFQRFQKLSAAPTAGESQTGLGLAISQQLITMMGGKIAGANNDAGGSTFTAFFAK